jgi:hypothetical protein
MDQCKYTIGYGIMGMPAGLVGSVVVSTLGWLIGRRFGKATLAAMIGGAVGGIIAWVLGFLGPLRIL